MYLDPQLSDVYIATNENFIPVRHSEWASPIVVIPKKDSEDIRICIDYKPTVNPAIKTDVYPMHRREDVFNKVRGCTVFCVIDLANAYLQVPLSEQSRKILVASTHMGLFEITRLPYGVSSAPSIFQQIMDNILMGLPGVGGFFDDHIIGGKDLQECKERFHAVLKRLDEHNVRLNLRKAQRFKHEVIFLGHKVNSSGIHPVDGKVVQINEFATPKDVSQLRSYLGMLNHYGPFIPNMSRKLKPLYELLQSSEPWQWTKEREECFQNSKRLLIDHNVLVMFDPELPLHLICDGSPYGIGAILAHEINGELMPVYCASATLSSAEQGYAQPEREALAVVFGVKYFHKYLYGSKFIIWTDAQALRKTFGPSNAIPPLAAARIQRWALILAQFNYEIRYRKDVQMADALSRLPSARGSGDEEAFGSVLNIGLPLTDRDIRNATLQDKNLVKVLEYTRQGWPHNFSEKELMPYFRKREEISITDDCLMWANRVIVPKVLRDQVLTILHENHPGIVRTKQLARSSVWWPNIDADIEEMVLKCEPCQFNQAKNSQRNLVPWPKAQSVFERVHIDFLHFRGHDILLLVDAYSKWLELWALKRTDAKPVIRQLRQCFSVFGLPETQVSDNGPPFNSSEYAEFLMKNGIKRMHSPPYHPQSNGQAERYVGTAKSALAKMLHEKFKNSNSVSFDELQLQLTNFLFSWRNTPNSTGMSPAEMIFKKKPRTKVTILMPRQSAAAQNNGYRKPNVKQFVIGEKVLVRTQKYNKTMFLLGKIVKRVSYVTYLVYVDHKTRFVHTDHLKKTKVCNDYNDDSEDLSVFDNCTFGTPNSGIQNMQNNNNDNGDGNLNQQNNLSPVVRRSVRTRKSPDRYGDWVKR